MMIQIPPFSLIITCEFNQEKQQFEVFGTDEQFGVHAVMLTMTVDDVKEYMKETIVETLQSISQAMLGGTDEPE